MAVIHHTITETINERLIQKQENKEGIDQKRISYTKKKRTWKIVTISLVIDSTLDSESLFKRPGTS